MTIGTPLAIKLLIHIYVTPEPVVNEDAPAVQETLNNLALIGAIQFNDTAPVWSITPLGVAWVNALCNVATPRQVFVDEQGKIL